MVDVRLERKLRYEYYKFKARYQFVNRSRYALATPIDAGSERVVQSKPIPSTTSGENLSRVQGDPGPDV